MLGEPLITVEIHDTQLDLAINNAVEEWSREAPMDQDYYAVDLEDYVEDTGVMLPSNVAGVFTFNDQTVFSGNGSSVNIGAKALGAVCTQIENCIDDEVYEPLEAHIKSLKTTLVESLEFLNNKVNS